MAPGSADVSAEGVESGGHRRGCGRLMASRSGRPSSTSMMFAAAAISIARRASTTADPRCGVKTVRAVSSKSAEGMDAGCPGIEEVLHFKDIGRVPAKPAGLQGLGHGLFIHHRASARVDETGPRFHAADGLLPRKMKGSPAELAASVSKPRTFTPNPFSRVAIRLPTAPQPTLPEVFPPRPIP